MTRTMPRRAALAGALSLAVTALAGCGGQDGHVPSSGDPVSIGSPASSGGPTSGTMFNDADVAFAQMMIVHHRQAVEMSALVDGRAADREVQELAQKIKAAQDPEIAAMTRWLISWGQPTASADGGGHGSGHGAMPGMMSAADMGKLKAASGVAFDRQFCTMMIAHHEGAVTMAQEELANGANPEAKALAQRIVTTQQAEIDAMHGILDRL